MDKRPDVITRITGQCILPLYFHEDPQVSIDVLKALHEAGISVVEYAHRGEAALRNFEQMRRFCDRELPGMYLGIGTVKNAESAQAYIDAGSDFIICPGMLESVAEITERHKVLWVPGCMTPTEIISAEACGARMVKLYPMNTLGPPFLGAVKALFPDILFMPTGGIAMDKKTIGDWLEAGVCAIGGSKLITRPILDGRLYERLTQDTRDTLAHIPAAEKRFVHGMADLRPLMS